MEFNLEAPRDQLFVLSVNEGRVRISNDEYCDAPFILSGEELVAGWDVRSVADINESTLQVIFDMNPEIVLIGTGQTQVFLPVQVQALFYRRGIGFEVMTTDAACRTYNVLATDGRHVVAALLV